MNHQHTPVLIVGAGLSGLSTALFLGLHGVSATLVDRHPGTSQQPKARGQMPPIMEALGAAGLTDAILDATPEGRPEMVITICESAVGRVMHSFAESFPDFGTLSPAPPGMASQQRAERALADRAAELGADLRFATRMESFTCDDDGVTVMLRDLGTDQTYQITADHLVAADGHRGDIARSVGIGTHSRRSFGQTTTVLFTAGLDDRLPDAAVLMYYAQNPALPDGSGAFVSTDRRGEYVAAMSADPDRTDEQVVELVRTIVGVPDLQLQVLGQSTWEIGHRVADRMSAGRVHLVGDAAHLMPPTGGQGGNTAMIDGLHLAWKLAAVVKGEAGPGLLAGHSDEQLPYDETIADWQYVNMIERQRPDLIDDTLPAPVEPNALMFGYVRPSGAFVAEEATSGAEETAALFEDPTRPSGRPGTRAPHVWLIRNATRVSTRELFYRGFVLLTGGPATGDRRPAVGRGRGEGRAGDRYPNGRPCPRGRGRRSGSHRRRWRVRCRLRGACWRRGAGTAGRCDRLADRRGRRPGPAA